MLSEQETRIISEYRKLNAEEKAKFMEMLEIICLSPEEPQQRCEAPACCFSEA